MNPSVPSDDEVVLATKELRQANPNLGRAKMLEELRSTRNWTLSEARFKRLTPSANQLQNEERLSQLGIPRNANAVQRRYRDESTRIFKIYGRGEYNYGVSPNSDQQILFIAALNRLKEAGRPVTEF